MDEARIKGNTLPSYGLIRVGKLLDQQRDVVVAFWASGILPIRGWRPRIWCGVQYSSTAAPEIQLERFRCLVCRTLASNIGQNSKPELQWLYHFTEWTICKYVIPRWPYLSYAAPKLGGPLFRRWNSQSFKVQGLDPRFSQAFQVEGLDPRFLYAIHEHLAKILRFFIRCFFSYGFCSISIIHSMLRIFLRISFKILTF